jgi:hypothetical protein
MTPSEIEFAWTKSRPDDPSLPRGQQRDGKRMNATHEPCFRYLLLLFDVKIKSDGTSATGKKQAPKDSNQPSHTLFLVGLTWRYHISSIKHTLMRDKTVIETVTSKFMHDMNRRCQTEANLLPANAIGLAFLCREARIMFPLLSCGSDRERLCGFYGPVWRKFR